jgi:CRP-like cAMP-binding protein
MYFIRSGRVQIQARHPDGSVFLTKDLKPGNFFGEISLLTGEPRTADVVAQEDSALLMLDKEDFRRLLTGADDDTPELISKVLARREELSREKEGSLLRQTPGEDGTVVATASRSGEMLKKIRDFFAV